MLSLGLYLTTVLIWGTTWFAIRLQLGSVAVEASILYRFVIAGALLFAGLALLRRLQPLGVRDHLFCVLQGACLFCFNFLAFYHATGYVPSGLVSVIFSLASVMNAFNGWLWLRRRPARRVIAGAVLGVAGVGAMFWPELAAARPGAGMAEGLTLAVLGTWCFSTGNIVSLRHQQRGLRPPTTNAWGMLYGVLILAAVAFWRGVPFDFDPRPEYLASLLYLAIPGTIVAFTAYLTLVGRIGADRAAYCTVLFPAVALTISTVFEGYRWTPLALAGFVLVLAGNLLIFLRVPGRVDGGPALPPRRWMRPFGWRG